MVLVTLNIDGGQACTTKSVYCGQSIKSMETIATTPCDFKAAAGVLHAVVFGLDRAFSRGRSFGSVRASQCGGGMYLVMIHFIYCAYVPAHIPKFRQTTWNFLSQPFEYSCCYSFLRGE